MKDLGRDWKGHHGSPFSKSEMPSFLLQTDLMGCLCSFFPQHYFPDFILGPEDLVLYSERNGVSTYIQRVLEKKKKKTVVKRKSSMKYFKKLSQAWRETFYIEQDHFNKADEKLPTSRQIIVKFQNTGDRKKRFKGKMLFSDKENRDQNGFLFLNSNFFFFFKGNGAIFSKFWRKTVFNLEFLI